MKVCILCYKLKSLSEFYFHKTSKDGHFKHCINCRKEYEKARWLKIKDKVNEERRKILKTPEIRLNKYNYNQKYYKKNKIKLRNYSNNYRKTHKFSINEKFNFRYKNDIRFKLNCNLHTRINLAIKGTSKSLFTMSLIGCEIDYLMYRLQLKFQPGMTWDNYGKDGWEVDHIIPCASFDLTKPKQQKECFHYSNLQPLWSINNKEKGVK
jgi:hypothetical protein